MKITVLPIPVENIETTWDGVTRAKVKQWAQIETQPGLATSFVLTSDPGKEYQPGEYELAQESFSVTNGRLTVSRVVLKPVHSARPSIGKPATV
jgi:hypothetical protein